MTSLEELFCHVDDFCQAFEPNWQQQLISHRLTTRQRSRSLCLSEIMTILIGFHQSHYRNFKKYYECEVCKHWQEAFPKLVSYQRFVDWIPGCLMPLCVYLKHCFGTCTGISFIDATSLKVCHNRRISQNKVFEGMAARGKTSVDWFYGFKLHIITNDQGGIIDFMITKGNVDDRKPLRFKAFVKKLFGKLFGDKGYISKDLFTELFSNGVHLVTKLRKNMKTKLLTPMTDAYHLRKRAIIETIFDQLKNICQIEHSRHRSVANYFNNIFAALIAYNFKDKKPSLKNNFVDTKQLYLTL